MACDYQVSVHGKCVYYKCVCSWHVPTRVGFKYTFCNQIQLSQIKYKYIAFPDFNSKATTNFKYKYTAIFYSNTLPFLKFELNMIQILARVSNIVQVYHSE